jgi:hypothetical protein
MGMEGLMSITGTMQAGGHRFPDTTSMVVLALRAATVTGTLYPATYAPAYGTLGARTLFVAIDLSHWDRKSPSVQVRRIGGTASAMFDEVLLQIDVRTDQWDDCTDTMELVRQAMGNLPLSEQAVKSVEETEGVRFLPDVGEDRARVSCDFVVTVASNP